MFYEPYLYRLNHAKHKRVKAQILKSCLAWTSDALAHLPQIIGLRFVAGLS